MAFALMGGGGGEGGWVRCIRICYPQRKKSFGGDNKFNRMKESCPLCPMSAAVPVMYISVKEQPCSSRTTTQVAFISSNPTCTGGGGGGGKLLVHCVQLPEECNTFKAAAMSFASMLNDRKKLLHLST